MLINLKNLSWKVAEIDSDDIPNSLLIDGEVYAYRPYNYERRMYNSHPVFECVGHYEGVIRYVD